MRTALYLGFLFLAACLGAAVALMPAMAQQSPVAPAKTFAIDQDFGAVKAPPQIGNKVFRPTADLPHPPWVIVNAAVAERDVNGNPTGTIVPLPRAIRSDAVRHITRDPGPGLFAGWTHLLMTSGNGIYVYGSVRELASYWAHAERRPLWSLTYKRKP